MNHGSGRVQPARLSFADIHIGELHGKQLLQSPQPKKTRGGWDIEYDFTPTETKWLVCTYGGTEWSGLDRISPGAIQWWGKLPPQATHCLLRIRETKFHATLSDWTASTVCEP